METTHLQVPANTPPQLRLELFGSPRLQIDGSPIQGLKSSKARGLLIYLAVTGEYHSRLALASLLWGNLAEQSARGNLRKAIQTLRTHCGNFVEIEREGLQLDRSANVWVDVVEFKGLLQETSQQSMMDMLYRAVDLYKGDFLTGFYLHNAPEFETWWLQERASLREMMLDALIKLADLYSAERDLERATTLTRQFLEMEPWRESMHRNLMGLLSKSGRRNAAIVQYQLCKKILADEFGVDPEPETIRLYENILAKKQPTQPGPQTAGPTLNAHPANLPHPLNAFVGRDKELLSLHNLVASNRVVTLVGTGGIGKTALSIHLGRSLIDEYADGVWFIDLAAIKDPAMVPQVAALALGIKESGAESAINRLLFSLHEKHCLLILDNCEHVISGASQFAKTILENCEGIKIIATSREAIRIPGEIHYRVPKLSFPKNEHAVDFNNWKNFDAIVLFAKRAAVLSPGFQVTRENLVHIVRICQKLDGIPLTLEMVASGLDVLSLEIIASQMQDQLSLLTFHNRTAPPRQQSLRASLEWSWNLLSDTEKEFLRRFAMFNDKASLDSIDVICRDPDGKSGTALNALMGLVKKSFVNLTNEPGQERRYYLLESHREFAVEKLVLTDEEFSLRNRHLEYYRQLSKEAGPNLVRSEQAIWLTRLEHEIGNIRAALEWSIQSNIEAGLQICMSIWRFWAHYAIREGDSWLSEFLGQQIHAEGRAKALLIRSRLNYFSPAKL